MIASIAVCLALDILAHIEMLHIITAITVVTKHNFMNLKEKNFAWIVLKDD